MNPGKIIDPPPMTENLRYGANYRTVQIDTYFDFSSQGGFAGAIEMCNGVGACRKKLSGTMCPSYMVTQEEEHSTRGRANALRAVLSGTLPAEHFKNKRLYDVLSLCMECKACKAECASNVDMAKLKYEFLAHYYKANGLPLRNRFFGNIAKFSAIGTAFAPVSNWLVNSGISKWAMERIVGIDRRRTLPTFASESFEKWYARRTLQNRPRSRKQVVLYHDTFMNYNEPQIGKAAVAVLEAAGFEVILPDKRCCGRPMISKGMLNRAIENARYNIENLLPYAQKGTPIIGCEPSCISALRDDYIDLIPGADSELVAQHTYMIDEFLFTCHESGELHLKFKDAERDVLLHGHCHQKALIGISPSVGILSLPTNYNVEVIDSGCCGMAGAFGYEAEHYNVSMDCGRRQLFKAVEKHNGDFEIAAAGFACRHQIEHGTGRTAKHLIEVFRDAILET